MDQLLARGSLGGPHYDEVWKRVLERTETVSPRWPRRWTKRALRPSVVLPGLAFASVVAAWLVFLRPSQDHFTPKGSPDSASGVLQIDCAPLGGRACRIGATMMFTVNAALTSGYLGAYAERMDDPGHARIWYFPSSSDAGPIVVPGNGTVVVRDGIQIGPEHTPGKYRVTVWISSRPLRREEVAGVAPDVIRSRSTFEVEIAP